MTPIVLPQEIVDKVAWYSSLRVAILLRSYHTIEKKRQDRQTNMYLLHVIAQSLRYSGKLVLSESWITCPLDGANRRHLRAVSAAVETKLMTLGGYTDKDISVVRKLVKFWDEQ